MRNAIWVTYHHYSSTDKNPQHEKCPSGKDSWCEWPKAAAKNELKSFKHSYTPLPSEVLNTIKPIYEDLSKYELLERCIGGFTQNNNESLNQLMWKTTPKSISGASNIVDIAANVAASCFNEGNFALLAFLHHMGVKMGTSSHQWVRATDINRISRANGQKRIAKKDELFEDNSKKMLLIFLL